MTDKPPLKVTCPTCKGTAIYSTTNPWRPFCSERCREIDLGAWATERFHVAVKDDAMPDDDMMSPGEAPTPGL